jgi:hypothetical protein
VVRAGVPKPPPPRPRPPEPRPAAKAKAEPAPRSPERIRADIAADREAAARRHFALLDETARAAAERVLAGGAVRVSRRTAAERRLDRWAELTGRRVWIGGKLWGNPFRPWRDEGRRPTDAELAASHALYRAHVLSSPGLMARLPGLRGKVLDCGCPADAACHGAVLIELIDDGGGA